ncbi:MAG: TIM barrel protein [Pacificimonas sp.]
MTTSLADSISATNADFSARHRRDFEHIGEKVSEAGFELEEILNAASAFELAIPSWGVGTGGTRFARFPVPGEPATVFEKIDDCAVVQALVGICPRVSPHFPWDTVDDYNELRGYAEERGLGFDAVNSNVFQDQVGQAHSYKFGSLTHSNANVRDQAIAHNHHCIEIGKILGSRALTVWIGDGANFPGQQDFTRSFDRYLDSAKAVYAALPTNWTMLLEHKLFEPAFYATVIQDWGSSFLAADALGPKAQCLVDLGHHAPSVNIEMIVARLAWAKKLGGFHFNDSKYGDDDLDAGSIQPFQLFLVFNELVEAQARTSDPFCPAYMMDQSHNVTDPIESLMLSADAILCAYLRALLIDRRALRDEQDANDVVAARSRLQNAYQTDVRPLAAEVRQRAGGALNPLTTYRASGYRTAVAAARPSAGPAGGGIV